MSTVRRIIWAGFIVAGVILFAVGCRGNDPQMAARTESAGYPVVDSLLSTFSYHVPGTGLTLRPPLGFEQAHDSILLMLQNRQAQVGGNNGVRMVACFLDTLHTAGLMISVIDNPAVSADTGLFFERYRQSLYKLFGADKVREEDLSRDSVFRKVFTIPEESVVRVQCLAYTPSGNPLEVTYFVDNVNAVLVRPRIESSVAGFTYSREALDSGQSGFPGEGQNPGN